MARTHERLLAPHIAGVLSILALTGCTETVSVGKDCITQTRECSSDSVTTPEDDKPDDNEPTELDAGAGDANGEPEDAGQKNKDATQAPMPPPEPADAGPVDAGSDASPIALLPLMNADFERNGGLGGDLVLSKLIGTLLPIPPIPLLFAELPGWYACWATTVHSVSREFNLDAGLMQVQNDYLVFVVNGTPVRQQLSTPIAANTRYALEMDVLARPAAGEQLLLEIRGANEECAVGDLLGASKPLADDAGWTTACVEFTTKHAYTSLLIAPTATGARPSGNSRVSLDALRSVPGCPTVSAVPSPPTPN